MLSLTAQIGNRMVAIRVMQQKVLNGQGSDARVQYRDVGVARRRTGVSMGTW